MKKIITILMCFILLLSITACGNKKEEMPKTEITLIEKLDFEINSELNLLSLLNKINNGELISKDETIDTSVLGEKDITIKYLNESNEEKEYTFKITIIDTQKPIIEGIKELSTIIGTKIDLLKDIKVVDNSKEDIKATVEGEYDFNKEGTYNLKYIAIDSSNNKTEEEFILKVNKKATSSNSNNSSSGQNSYSNPSISISVSSVNAKIGEWTNVSMVRANLSPSDIESFVSVPDIITWSFNSTSATDATIRIYGKSIGTTVLTVKSKDGKASKQLTINVIE